MTATASTDLKRLRARTARLFAAAAAAAVAAYLVGVASADGLLAISETPVPADTMVVLGGDGPTRARKTLELWNIAIAPHVIIAGDGDCMFIRQTLIDGGVPATSIETECLSRNTWENALLTAPLLEKADVHTAILVTSWFHSRRALASFRAICPDIRWISAPTTPPASLAEAFFGPDGPAIAQEYAKTVLYQLRLAYFALTQPSRTGPCYVPLSGG